MSTQGYSSDVSAGPDEGLQQLLASVQSFRRVMGAAARGDARYEGTDATELVSLVLDGVGGVESVRISPEWFQRRGASSLGLAMYEAYQAAMTRAMEASVGQMDAAEDQEQFRAAEPSETYSPRVWSGRPQDFQAPSFADIRDRLWTIQEQQYQREYLRERRRVEQPAERLVYGPYGMVTVRMRGVGITEITVLSNAGRDDVPALEHDALVALRTAGRPAAGGDNRETGGV